MDIRMIKEADWKTWAMAALVMLLILSAVVGWYRGQKTQTILKTQYITVPEIKETVKLKRVEIPVEKIVVIEKEAAARRLDLPPEIKDDPNKQITATAVIPSYEGKTNVLAVIDTGTGASSIVAKQVPLPFMDFINDRVIGARWGYSMEHGLEIDGFVQWNFFRVASARVGLYGEVNSTGDAKGMIQTEWHF